VPVRGIVGARRPTACLLRIIRRHWEARPASSRTTSGVQSLVGWGEHGRMRTPSGVRGKGWKKA